MNFTEDYILENNRVLIRPLQQEDFKYLEHFPVNEPNLWQYSPTPPDTKEKLKSYIAAALVGKNDNTEYPFIIFDKVTKQYAGCTRFYNISLFNKHCCLGYTWYGKAFQGSGINKNCKYLLLKFAFETLTMERVQFNADNRNKRSINALMSIGCTVEGVLRNHKTMPDGYRRDTIILSILSEDWYDSVKEALKNDITI